MVDALFADERLAALYDLIEDGREDLVPYLALVAERDAHMVVDIGCGTGTFACLLAQRGVQVVGVDPAVASLAIARASPAPNVSSG